MKSEFESNVIQCLNELKKAQRLKEKLVQLKKGLGYLEPITYNYKNIRPNYIGLLSKWRKENPEGFANVFEVSEKRTEFWIDNILLKREDRILFIIYNEDELPLGHIGLSSFDFKNKSCEIDNVVRGNKSVSKGIMSIALNTLVDWGQLLLRLNGIFLKVLDDNVHAKNFYFQNGFVEITKIPLYKEVLDDEIRWGADKVFNGQQPDRYYSLMKLINKKGEV